MAVTVGDKQLVNCRYAHNSVTTGIIVWKYQDATTTQHQYELQMQMEKIGEWCNVK